MFCLDETEEKHKHLNTSETQAGEFPTFRCDRYVSFHLNNGASTNFQYWCWKHLTAFMWARRPRYVYRLSQKYVTPFHLYHKNTQTTTSVILGTTQMCTVLLASAGIWNAIHLFGTSITGRSSTGKLWADVANNVARHSPVHIVK